MTNTRRPDRAFIGVAALVFVASTAVTIAWCSAMASMPGMEMPGGWTMSMAWMRMPGQTWPGAAATFLGMWTLMMIAMMLPVLVPMLVRYRRALKTTDAVRLARLTLVVSAAYFLVWAMLGMAVYAAGVVLAQAAMTRPSFSRAVPLAIGVVVMLAGLFQFTAWKARELACCRAPAAGLRAGSFGAFRHGSLLGIRCIRCCAGLTAILPCLGVMDLRLMAILTAAICMERLPQHAHRFAHLTGAMAASAGLWLIGLSLL
jgi:predicted metal-binding membrane protein